MATDKILFKPDFSNAFNILRREAVLEDVRSHFPELEHWVRWTYCDHSNLRFGRHKLSSQVGMQQGNPLGPFLFAFAMQPIAAELAQDEHLDMTTFYLDAGILSGSTAAVASALQKLQ